MANVPVVACKVTVPLPVPVPALRANQPVVSLALQFKVPPPVLLILSVCAAGLLPPWIAVNARLVGLAPMAGGTGAAVTVKETGIAMGVTPVPPLRVTVPVWLPTAKAPVVACTVIVPLPVPAPAVRVSQPEVSLALQVKVPPPVFRILSV